MGDDGLAVNSVERFNPDVLDRGIWEIMPPMGQAREATSAGVIDGKLYVCGGFDKDRKPLNYSERFDPSAGAWGTWEALPHMQGRRGGAAAGVTRGRLFMCGGRDRD